jgi:putative FmdB family regulatory protein
MPLYEFRCEACGEFEAWRTIAELSQPVSCPSCNSVAKRIFSPPNINLNVGSLQVRKGNGNEPKLVNRDSLRERYADREPEKPKYQSTQSGRPWAISHSPARY